MPLWTWPPSPPGMDSPTSASQASGLARQRRRIARFQERLFASSSTALLLVFQGMDAAGKDGAIRAVLKGVNPQGISVTSFKEPVGAELSHSWLWRHWLTVPARGQIGVFNRSHYEEVAVVRVHPELLAARGLPASAA